jgi:hypothetical protein
MTQIVVPADQLESVCNKAGSDIKFLFEREGIEIELQAKFYFAGVLTVKHFASFVDNKADLRRVLKTNFSLDPDEGGDIFTRVKVSKVLVAWDVARARATKLADAEGEATVRNIPKEVCATDYEAMRSSFEGRYWEVTDSNLPGRAYLEKKLDEVEKGEHKAELLSEVVSKEEDEPDSLKTIWGVGGGELKAIKVASTVPLPVDTETLRRRITLLGTACIFVATQHTNRAHLRGVTPQLFQEYLQYLLGEYVLGMLTKDGLGRTIHNPAWHLLIGYEHAIRVKAAYLIRKGATYRDALRTAWDDAVTKERHFSTPLAMDTVTRRAPQQPSYPSQPGEPLSKKAKKAAAAQKGKGKGKGKPDNTTAGLTKGKTGGCARTTPDGKPVCINFNSAKGCTRDSCRFLHACGKCFTMGVSLTACPTCH